MPLFFVDPDISRAETLDTDFYTSPMHFELAKEKIFAPAWHFIGDEGLVPEAGSVYPFTLLNGYLNEPLLLSRNKENNLHCLSNVCTHRGNVLITAPCKASQIRCRYHGRIFSLDGSFQSMPEFKEVKNFPRPSDNLHACNMFSWGKLLFTSLLKVEKAEMFLQDMMHRMHWFPVNDLVFKPNLSKDYLVNANWALYCENYLEGFHIPFVHATLNQALDFGNYTTELFEWSSLQLGVGKKDEICFNLPSTSKDYGRQIAAYYFWVFPNMMFNFYPWGLSVNIVQPLTTGTCRVSFLTYVANENLLEKGAGSGLDHVEMEDEEVVENVQKGIRSRFYTHGRYSVKHEKGTHHFHRLLAQCMG